MTKHYPRDGIQYDLVFGLNADKGACTMRVYKVTSSYPGSKKTVYPPHTAPVADCRCE